MIQARELGWPDLVWSHFSRPRHDDFDARVAAAAAAGFSGVGLFVGTYQAMRREGRSDADLRDVLARAGVALAEIEALRLSATASEAEATALAMADAFGCRYLQVIGPYEGEVADAAEAFAGLCDRAAEHGLLAGIEWLPFTNIVTLDDALEIVELADRPNGGLCVDSWHLTRTGGSAGDIGRLRPERVMAVQLNDGPLDPDAPDYYEDCLTNRVPPGDGAFDLVGIVRALDDIGVNAPISLEVCSAELWDAPVTEAARRSADGMREVLTAAGVRPSSSARAPGGA